MRCFHPLPPWVEFKECSQFNKYGFVIFCNMQAHKFFIHSHRFSFTTMSSSFCSRDFFSAAVQDDFYVSSIVFFQP